MARVREDKDRNLPVPVWATYQEIINKAEGKEVSLTFPGSRFNIPERRL